MAITNPNPLEIPATEAKSFHDIWLTEVRIYAPTPTTGGISIQTLPFNGSTGEIADRKHQKTIITNDLWLASSEVPEVAAAMQAVFAAVPALEAWLDSKNPPDEGVPE